MKEAFDEWGSPAIPGYDLLRFEEFRDLAPRHDGPEPRRAATHHRARLVAATEAFRLELESSPMAGRVTRRPRRVGIGRYPMRVFRVHRVRRF